MRVDHFAPTCRPWRGRRPGGRHRRLVPFLGLALWLLAAGGFGKSPDSDPADRPLPPFHQMEAGPLKKQEFFDYLLPVVRGENERIRRQRQRLEDIAAVWQRGSRPARRDRQFLERLADEYRLDFGQMRLAELIPELLQRVDVIPRSLVLVQAAKESGWGSSRFARYANNLFGEWCFEPGCGLVPRQRMTGQVHEVRSFDSVQESVASYVRNLNTHPSYEELRELRAELRARDVPITGVALAEGLERYSERGEAYVREVQSMIRFNRLEEALEREETEEAE